MVTHRNFLVTMVISVAVGALILVNSAPTLAGGHSFGGSKDASFLGSTGGSSSTGQHGTIFDPPPPSTGGKNNSGSGPSGQSTGASGLNSKESGAGAQFDSGHVAKSLNRDSERFNPSVIGVKDNAGAALKEDLLAGLIGNRAASVKVPPKAGKGKEGMRNDSKTVTDYELVGSTDNGNGTTNYRYKITYSDGSTDTQITTQDNKTGKVLGCEGGGC